MTARIPLCSVEEQQVHAPRGNFIAKKLPKRLSLAGYAQQ
jgi:hypothetical protein